MVCVAFREDRAIDRRRITISGTVQGVGFRPFVFRLAGERGFSGWVRNSPSGVEMEVQGESGPLDGFTLDLKDKAPPLAVVTRIESVLIPPVQPCTGFRIVGSAHGDHGAHIAPDTSLCADCRNELFDPSDRRYRYPFITCTNCGPRWTIVTGVPYDRPFTTMSTFPLCSRCRAEYGDPRDRRFHAQPLACAACGPLLVLRNADGTVDAADDPFARARELLTAGKILAVKGLGGYHLAVDARNPGAVSRLRRKKARDEKPFAVMVADMDAARHLACIGATEERLLSSPESPVVIVRKREGSGVAEEVAPANGWLGIMLPSTPVHHLLFEGQAENPDDPRSPQSPAFSVLVMTSGNVSDEPVCYDDDEALDALSGIADAFLFHNRAIHVRTDDSVMRVFNGQPLFYRRSRGYVPRPLLLPFELPALLAVGAELKNTVCLTTGRYAFPSQHIGDLKNDGTMDGFRHAVSHMKGIFSIEPEAVACDRHPDYRSTLFAEELGLPLLRVQHHHSHMASCMAENGLDGEVIGLVFDGTGLGNDGTIWGGEFLVGGYSGFSRAGHLVQVPLPGGDAAVREPWRMAFSWLRHAFGGNSPDMPFVSPEQGDDVLELLALMMDRGMNSPPTSSCGRLFDAVAAILGLRNTVSYDGQAAMELEFLAETAPESALEYEMAISEHAGVFLLDPSPFIRSVYGKGTSPGHLARQFHQSLTKASADICCRLSETTGLKRVVLSGGVFQNRLLNEMLLDRLTKEGFEVFTHRLVPPNDGGISLGQAMVAARS